MLRHTSYRKPELISSQREPTSRFTTFVGPSDWRCFNVDFSNWRRNLDGSLRLGRFFPTITILWVIRPKAARQPRVFRRCWASYTPKAPAGSIGSMDLRDGKSGTIIGTLA